MSDLCIRFRLSRKSFWTDTLVLNTESTLEFQDSLCRHHMRSDTPRTALGTHRTKVLHGSHHPMKLNVSSIYEVGLTVHTPQNLGISIQRHQKLRGVSSGNAVEQCCLNRGKIVIPQLERAINPHSLFLPVKIRELTTRWTEPLFILATPPREIRILSRKVNIRSEGHTDR